MPSCGSSFASANPKMIKILLIKLKNIGDALLLTPTIQGIKRDYPDSYVAALVRSGTETILSGCPGLDTVFVSAPPEGVTSYKQYLHDLANLRRIKEERFDYVFELSDNDRGRWMAVFSGGKARVTSLHGWPSRPWYFRKAFTDFSWRNWHLMHRAEKDYRLVADFLPLNDDIPPLAFDVPKDRDPDGYQQGPYALVHPVSRWKRKSWPVERWVAVCKALIQRGLFCVISSGPDAEEVSLAETICSGLGENAVSTRGKKSWTELASLIKHARLFVGVDTAAMHLAAACQCPVVTLFGPSIEHHWHPWKSPYEIISAGGMLHQRYPDFLYDAEKRSMLDIQVDEVIAACDRMLKTDA